MTKTLEMISGATVPRIEVSLRPAKVCSRIVGTEAASMAEVAGLFRWLAEYPQETLLAVNLDARNRIRHFAQVAVGGRHGFAIGAMEVLRPAFLTNSSGLVLIHNHPEGDPRPSRRDIEFTRQIRRGCRTLGLLLHEHLVIGYGGLFCRIVRQMDEGETEVLEAA